MSFSDIADQVVRIAGKVTAMSVANSVGEAVGDELKRARMPIFRFLMCVVTSATGIVLLVIGAIQGLGALQLPPWSAYLGLGAIAMLGGFALLARKT